MSAPAYNPVTAEIAAELRRIVGDRHVVMDAESLAAYSHDESKGLAVPGPAEVVVKPRTAQEVAEIVRLANRRLIPVTPRGAGSGLSGGAVPARGGILLSCERMNSIIEIDAENLMIVVEPGVVTNEINERLKERGLFYAGYPMSTETCFIGGNIAENAGGGRAVKYGVTERYVLGVQVVTPTGEIAEFGGKLVKNATGYNLVKLFAGSEGTLGIVTRATLKLLPLPKASVALLALFPDTASAIGAVPKIMTEGGVIPTAIEFMDQASARAACQYLNETLPWEDAGAMLLIEIDGSHEDTVVREYETVGEMCLKHGASEVFVADNATTRQRVWNVRKNIPEAFNLLTNIQSGEDIVVPPAQIPRMLEAFARVAERHGMVIPCFGHAGDGNLHARVMKGPQDTEAAWRAKLPGALKELYREAKALGGSISGEHGIGLKRKKYIGLALSETELDFMRRIKQAVDPNNIMNPGKIFEM
ncbi:MAG TPA: FAD-linked oxidase C-terminal domain-containing protein [Candidatus Brocadiia bacterium]|nr:FAD-linked oxidase C-terminal domain-containing protein [Candidatus Brocadiia bacterium]